MELDSNSPNGLDRSAVLVVGTTMEQLGSKMVTGPRALPTSQVSRTFRHPAIGRLEQSATSTLQAKMLSSDYTSDRPDVPVDRHAARRSTTPGDLAFYIYK